MSIQKRQINDNESEMKNDDYSSFETLCDDTLLNIIFMDCSITHTILMLSKRFQSLLTNERKKVIWNMISHKRMDDATLHLLKEFNDKKCVMNRAKEIIGNESFLIVNHCVYDYLIKNHGDRIVKKTIDIFIDCTKHCTFDNHGNHLLRTFRDEFTRGIGISSMSITDSPFNKMKNCKYVFNYYNSYYYFNIVLVKLEMNETLEEYYEKEYKEDIPKCSFNGTRIKCEAFLENPLLSTTNRSDIFYEHPREDVKRQIDKLEKELSVKSKLGHNQRSTPERKKMIGNMKMEIKKLYKKLDQLK